MLDWRSFSCVALLVGCSGDDASFGLKEVPLDEGTFEVDPGEEGTYCVRIPVPREARGRDLALVGVDWDVPVPTHHYFMAYSEEPFPGTGDDPIPCEGSDAFVPINDAHLAEGKLLFGAGVGVGSSLIDSPYGRYMKAGGHFITDHHVLNLTPEPAELYARFTLHLKDARDVEFPIQQLNCLNMDIEVDPHSEAQVTGTCIVPFPVDIVRLGSHAHQFLERFETRIYDGTTTLDEVIYTSTDWDSPAGVELYDDPIHLEAGQGLTFTCHYRNDTDQLVKYGVGVDGEMCATMNFYAFPQDRPHEVPPNLGAFIVDSTEVATVFDTTHLDLPF